MTITFARRQSKLGSDNIDPGAATFDSTPIEGNLLVVTGTERNGGSADNLAISGTGWTKRINETTEQGDTNARRTYVVWTKIAGASEPTAISIDDGTSAGKRILIEEYEAGASVTWVFEDVALGNSGAGSTSPINTEATVSISGIQLLIGTAIWRTQTGTMTTDSFSGLGTLIQTTTGNNGRHIASAFAQSEVASAKSTSVAWTGTGHEGNAGLIVFSATEAGGGQDLNVGFLADNTQLFAPTIENQSALNASVGFLDSTVQLFAPTLENVPGDQDLEIPFHEQTNSIFPLSLANQSPLDLEVGLLGSGVQLFAPTLESQTALEITPARIESTLQIFQPTLDMGDHNLEIPFLSDSTQLFAPTLENQSPLSISPARIESTIQLFAPTIELQSNLNLEVAYLPFVNMFWTPSVSNEGEELFEPTLVGNGTLADRILAGLIDQGFLTGSIVDREYARLLAKLTLVAPQSYSISDLYSLAGEKNRILGIGVDNLGVPA